MGSIGGDDGALTLPNLINSVKAAGAAPVVGSARGELSRPTFKATCTGKDVDVCRLSSAVDGSDIQDLIDLQVSYLNDTLSTAEWAANVSVQTDWKLLTIFSGLDDAVFYNTSTPGQATSPAVFTENLERLLQSIYSTFPNTFVNLVMLPEEFNPEITTSRLTCKLFKWYSEHAGIHWTDTRTWVNTSRTYNAIFIEIARRWKAKGLLDFGVSLQPFMQSAHLSMSDMDTLDCFHPNLASHQGMAVGLWNNMQATSFAEKAVSWKAAPNTTCPNSSSRLVV